MASRHMFVNLICKVENKIYLCSESKESITVNLKHSNVMNKGTNEQSFPIIPLASNVIVKVEATIKVLLATVNDPLKDIKVNSTVVCAVGADVSNVKIGDNVILNGYANKQPIDLKDNLLTPELVLAAVKDIKIVGAISTDKTIVSYYAVNALDIVAIDNQ